MLIEFHRAMLADQVRNAAFHEALRRVIVPGETTVADIGCGTGLLAFMASRLGARQVHCYEHGEVIHLAERLAKANGIRNLVFYQEHSTAILDPEPVDVVVSETLGNFAYEENILETLRDARRFLRRGGLLLPKRITQHVAPVVSGRIQSELEAWDRVGYGLAFAAAKAMSLNNLYVRTIQPDELLDAPGAAQRWDQVALGTRASSVRSGAASWTLDRPATVYGFALWWCCELLPGLSLTTDPAAPPTHWEQLYLPTLEALRLSAADRLELRVRSDTTQAGATIRWQVSHIRRGSDHPLIQRLDMSRGDLG